MSLILEALRKSEAERRRGSAPDLARELPPVAAPLPVAPRTWWLAGVAVVAVSSALFAWSLQPSPDAAGLSSWARDASSSETSPASGDGGRAKARVAGATVWPEVPRIAPAASPTPAESGDTGVTDTVEAAGVANALVADATGAGDADAGDARGPPGVPASPVPGTAAPPGRTGDAPTVTPVSRPPAATAARADGAMPDPVRERRLDATADARSPTASDATAGGRVPGPGESATGTGELRLSALSSDARARLPALRLTMHLWNEEPARRFVILDGMRLGVGDRVGAGTVAAIDADGVVIALDGQRVRLPLR